jgi:hypothetical protein
MAAAATKEGGAGKQSRRAPEIQANAQAPSDFQTIHSEELIK